MTRLLSSFFIFIFYLAGQAQTLQQTNPSIGLLYQPMLNHTEVGGILTLNDLVDSLGFQFGYHQNTHYNKYMIGINGQLTHRVYLYASLDFMGSAVNKEFFEWNVDGTKITKPKDSYRLFNKGFDLDLELGLSKMLKIWTVSPGLTLQWHTYGSFNARFDQFLIATGINFELKR